MKRGATSPRQPRTPTSFGDLIRRSLSPSQHPSPSGSMLSKQSTAMLPPRDGHKRLREQLMSIAAQVIKRDDLKLEPSALGEIVQRLKAASDNFGVYLKAEMKETDEATAEGVLSRLFKQSPNESHLHTHMLSRCAEAKEKAENNFLLDQAGPPMDYNETFKLHFYIAHHNYLSREPLILQLQFAHCLDYLAAEIFDKLQRSCEDGINSIDSATAQSILETDEDIKHMTTVRRKKKKKRSAEQAGLPRPPPPFVMQTFGSGDVSENDNRSHSQTMTPTLKTPKRRKDNCDGAESMKVGEATAVHMQEVARSALQSKPYPEGASNLGRAATKIQALVRGHACRHKTITMHEEVCGTNSAEEEETSPAQPSGVKEETLVEVQIAAVIKIQCLARGGLARSRAKLERARMMKVNATRVQLEIDAMSQQDVDVVLSQSPILPDTVPESQPALTQEPPAKLCKESSILCLQAFARAWAMRCEVRERRQLDDVASANVLKAALQSFQLRRTTEAAPPQASKGVVRQLVDSFSGCFFGSRTTQPDVIKALSEGFATREPAVNDNLEPSHQAKVKSPGEKSSNQNDEYKSPQSESVGGGGEKMPMLSALESVASPQEGSETPCILQSKDTATSPVCENETGGGDLDPSSTTVEQEEEVSAPAEVVREWEKYARLNNVLDNDCIGLTLFQHLCNMDAELGPQHNPDHYKIVGGRWDVDRLKEDIMMLHALLPSPEPAAERQKYAKNTVAQLKRLLTQRGVAIKGLKLKAEFVQKLEELDAAQESAVGSGNRPAALALSPVVSNSAYKDTEERENTPPRVKTKKEHSARSDVIIIDDSEESLSEEMDRIDRENDDILSRSSTPPHTRRKRARGNDVDDNGRSKRMRALYGHLKHEAKDIKADHRKWIESVASVLTICQQ